MPVPFEPQSRSSELAPISAESPLNELVKYSAARNALAEAWRVDEAKNIRDQALAMQVYAKQANDRSLIEKATDIRIRAEIRVGELLAEMKVRGERQKAGDVGTPKSRAKQDGSAQLPSLPPKLSELGVTRTQSSRWQRLAALSPAEQEELIGRAKHQSNQAIERPVPKRKGKPEPTHIQRGEGLGEKPEQPADTRPTTTAIIAANGPERKPQPVDAALWLWARLGEFEERYLDREPVALLATLTPQMFDDVRRRATIVARWLLQVAQKAEHARAQRVPYAQTTAGQPGPASSDGLEIPDFLDRRNTNKNASGITR